MDQETLVKVETQRLELENNIAKLRQSLRHWQTLEIDYEGLKEEYQGLPEDASSERCLEAARDFKPEIFNDEELQSIFKSRGQHHRWPSQLVELFSKRVDYVSRNISTIRKQLSDAERKRNALLLAEDPEHQDDAGLPVSEIVEELDDEGKIVSSRVQTPGKDAPKLVDVLRKAGVTDLKSENNTEEASPLTQHDVADNATSVTSEKQQDTSPSENTIVAEEDRIRTLTNKEGENKTAGVLGPTNDMDDEEEAAIRQEMLKYGLDEVGAIVAELDLQDFANLSDDDADADDYLSDYDEDEDLYTDESEDEKGATKNPIISERYKRQMEALSKKHGITDLKNLGPTPELPEGIQEQIDRPPAAEAARKAAIKRHETTKDMPKSPDAAEESSSEPKKKKKKVAFATSLDISSEEPQRQQQSLDSEPAVDPVGETVVERATGETPDDSTIPTPPSFAPPSNPKKMSRFKSTRTSTPQTPMFPPPMDFPASSSNQTPTGPVGKIISQDLVERPADRVTRPSEPLDFDENLHRREVAMEYQKMRDRKMHEQGGYVRGGAQENYGEEATPIDDEIVDERTGKTRKISRFKAARLQHSL